MNHLPIEIMYEYQQEWLREARNRRLEKLALMAKGEPQPPFWRLWLLSLAENMIRLGLILKAEAESKGRTAAHHYRLPPV